MVREPTRVAIPIRCITIVCVFVLCNVIQRTNCMSVVIFVLILKRCVCDETASRGFKGVGRGTGGAQPVVGSKGANGGQVSPQV